MNNIQQSLLNFHTKKTSDCITSKSGLALFYETALSFGLIQYIDWIFPKSGSNRGIKARDYVMSIVLMLTGGGKYMEDVRHIKNDPGLCKLCSIKKVPSPDAVANWLKNTSNLSKLKKIIEFLNKCIIQKSIITDFTVDVDATDIANEKECSKMTYKGYKANSVLLSFLSELGLCVADTYREGSAYAGNGIKDHILYVKKLLKPLNKNFRYLRSDSAGYNSEVMETCFENGIVFAIAADHDKAVNSAISDIPEESWKDLYYKDGVKSERQYASFVHALNSSKNAFTMIVQRYEDKQQTVLFKEFRYKYYTIATNDFERNHQDVIHFYNARGNAENYNKELKDGFGLEHAPSKNLKSCDAFFKLGILAYNISVAFKKIIAGGEWINKQIKTIRWQLIFIAGKVVRHSHQLLLKMSSQYLSPFNSLRNKIFEFAKT